MTNHRVEPIDLRIAQRAKTLREKSGLSLNAVGKVLGISYQSYTKMEAGQVSIRAGTLQKLSLHYGVPVAYFFDGYSAGASSGT